MMLGAYGHRWASAYGEEIYGANDELTTAAATWQYALKGVTENQIRRGANLALARPDPWPPTAPEFRELCKPSKLSPSDYHAAAEQNYQYLKKLPASQSQLQTAEGSRAGLNAMRAAIKPREHREPEQPVPRPPPIDAERRRVLLAQAKQAGVPDKALADAKKDLPVELPPIVEQPFYVPPERRQELLQLQAEEDQRASESGGEVA